MKEKKICIIGLGYVGLTLSLTFTNNKIPIHGIEINSSTLKSLKNGKAHFFEKGLDKSLSKALSTKKLTLSNKINNAKDCDTFIITVGTPLQKNGKPNFKFLNRCVKEIINLNPINPLIILRSTVAVGTARKKVLNIFNKANINVNIAMCPERTMEGVAMEEIKNLPQIIGGDTQISNHRAKSIFKLITKKIITVSSLETAELIKLVDNSSRDLYFATSNQLGLICESLNLNVYEVIKTANKSYSRTNLALPGLVGGPCLEKDPIILYESISDNKHKPKLFRDSRKLNKDLIKVILPWLKNLHIDYKKKSIAIMGLAFKGMPETSDVRGSLAIDIFDLLKKLKFKNIFLFDPVKETYNAPEIKKYFDGSKIIYNYEDLILETDIAIITNNHKFYSKFHKRRDLWKLNPKLELYDFWNNLLDAKDINKKQNYKVFGVN